MGQEKTNTFQGSILEVKVLKHTPYVMSPTRKGLLRFEEAEVHDNQIINRGCQEVSHAKGLVP